MERETDRHTGTQRAKDTKTERQTQRQNIGTKERNGKKVMKTREEGGNKWREGEFTFDFIGMKISGRCLVFQSVPANLLYENIHSLRTIIQLKISTYQ